MHISVIENKQTNFATWREKEKNWQEIAKKINSHSLNSNPKNAKTLRLKFEGIKKSTRHKTAEQKNFFCTGRGPYEKITLTDH